MTQQKTALLIGASGLIGGHCLQSLLKEPAYSHVVIFVRRPLSIMHEKLTQHIVDFSELETLGDCLTADDVYCCLGTTKKKAGTQDAFRKVDFDYPIKIAALTQHCGASQFLFVSSLGADPHSKMFYSRVKGDAEEALRRIFFNALHIFRPSLLLGDRTEWRMGEKAGAIILTGLKYALAGTLRKYRAISASDVARAMVSQAQEDVRGVKIYESEQIQRIADSI